MKFKHPFTGIYSKQFDKFSLKFRVSILDIISIKFDISRKKYEFIIFGFGITNY